LNTGFVAPGMPETEANLFRMFARLLPLALLYHLVCGSAFAQQADRPPNLNPGDAVVTGFSGTVAPDPTRPLPPNKSAADLTFINPDGPSARVVGVGRPGYVWDGRLFQAPKTFDVFAKDAGQLFGIALDDQPVPNIYLAATSAFGLNLVARGANGQPERRKLGGPGTGWMKGQFGLDLQGDPGSIYKVDGTTGAVTLFAKVMLDGVPNPGPALGNLAYDAAHKQLFVSDLYTGMIHRFAIADGSEPGPFYDHGVTGRRAANLPPLPFNPANRPNIASSRFNSENPDSWGFAPPERRVWGLAVQAGRLFYSARNGSTTEAPQIWSVGIAQDGSFAADARLEVDVTEQPGPYPVSDIAFSQRGAMILAQRAPIAASYDYSVFTRPGEPRVLRYWLKDINDPPSPGLWKPMPEEYAIGFAGTYRNTDGGVALGYGYGPDGMINTGACEAALWTTGQNLRNNPALRAQLEPGGPLLVNGLQGSPADMVRSANEPPATSYFIDYDDKFDDPRASGHMGSVRLLLAPCAGAVADSGSSQAGSSSSGPRYVSGPQTPTTTTTTTTPGCVGPNCYPPVVTPVNIAISKTAGGAKFDPATGLWTVEFKLDVSNAGNPFAPGNSISVTDPVPAGLTFVSAVGTNWTCTNSATSFQCGYNFGSGVFNTGAHLNQLVVTFTTRTPGKYENCASAAVAANSGFTETALSDNRSCDTVEVKPQPVDVALTKTAGAAVFDEKTGLWTISFKIDVTNPGNPFAPGNSLSIDDPVPAGLNFVSGAGTSWSCASSAGNIHCGYSFGSGVFNTGAHLNQLVLTFTTKTPGKYENCATVAVAAGSGFSESTLNNNKGCDTVEVKQNLDVAIAKTGVKAEEAASGTTNFTYTLAITNVGPAFAGAGVITVTDVVPAGMTFTSVSGAPNWNCTPATVNAGNTLTCTYTGSGPAAAGASLGSITVNATAKGDGPWTNCADVAIAAATGTDSNPGDNHSCVTLTAKGYVPVDPPPKQPTACGFDVIFVVDQSGSMAPYVSNVQGALNVAAGIFNHAPSQAALIRFSDSATLTYPMATSTYGNLNTGYSPAGETNWQAAMQKAYSLLPRTNTVIVFITDGDPNKYTDSNGVVQYTTNPLAAANAAIPVVNQIYAAGVPILGFGIGPNVSAANMSALLGSNFQMTPYSGLSGAMTTLAQQLCPGLYLTKSISPNAVNYYNDPSPPPVTVTLGLTNTAGTLNGVVVHDDLPIELTNPVGAVASLGAAATGPAVSNVPPSSAQVIWTIPSLPAGSATLSYNATLSPNPVPTAGANWHYIHNYAQVSAVASGGPVPNSTPGNMPNIVSGPVHEPDEAHASVYVYNQGPPPPQYCVASTLWVVKTADDEACEIGGTCSFHVSVTASCSSYTTTGPGISGFSGPVTFGDGVFPVPGTSTISNSNLSITSAALPAGASMSSCTTNATWTPSSSLPSSCNANVTLPLNQTISFVVTMNSPGAVGPYKNCFLADGKPGHPATGGFSPVYTDVNPPTSVTGGLWGDCASFNGETVHAPKPHCAAPLLPGPLAGQCFCPQGTVRRGTDCVPPTVCPPPSLLGPGDRCICPRGTVLMGNDCVKPHSCPPPFVMGPDDRCICPQGTVQSGNECVKPHTCPPPFVIGPDDRCICPQGTVQSGNECVKPHSCRPPFVIGPDDRCICPQGTVQSGNECVKPHSCPPPFVIGPDDRCICPQGTVRKGNECVKFTPLTCRAPLIPNADGTACVCRSGLVQTGRRCVEPVVCKPPMVPGPVAGKCVCSPPGSVLVNGKCVMRETCKPPATLNREGACQCPRNMVAKGNGCVERERPPTVTPGVPPRGRDNEPPRGGGRDNEPRGGHGNETPRGPGRDAGPPRGAGPTELPGRR
jgi:uncharacterized repeat protein (TIGR01451 family)